MKRFGVAGFVSVLLAACVVAGGASGEDIYELSLEDLLNMDISVASIKAKPIREQAGIVTVITRAEIAEMGAKDLQDILMQVPGYHFGADVTGVAGVGTRGFWSYDGKLVVIIDGIPMNETLYGTFPIGDHVFADQIEQIEIIRGPGSAMYGGNAEMAVINITTVASKVEGGAANVSVGTSGGEVTMRGGIAYGGVFSDEGRYFVSISWEDSYRSDRDYDGMDGVSFDMGDDSSIELGFINFGVDYKGLEYRIMYDRYYLEDRTFWGFWDPGLSDAFNMNFDTLAASVKYNYEANDWLMVSPKITYHSQNPWVMKGAVLNDEAPGSRYRLETSRLTYDLDAIASISDMQSVLVGVQYYEDDADAKNNFADTMHFGGESGTIDYENVAVYAQYEADTPIANFTVGARYDDHSFAGDSFVPRVGVTKVWDRFHTKLLYSEAFRTPQFELINYGMDEEIKPETTTSYELEAGYRFSDKVSVVANLFYMSIEDILIYEVLGDGAEGYRNWDEVANYGVEGELRIRDSWGNASVGYSFYANDENTVPKLETSDPDALLGFPQHKVTFNGTYKVTKSISLNLNGAVLGKRYGYNADGLVDFDPTVLANAFVNYKIGDYTVGIGVTDILDEGYEYIQPFNGEYAPIPEKSREVTMRVTAAF